MKDHLNRWKKCWWNLKTHGHGQRCGDYGGGVEEGIKGINADEIRKDKINFKDAIPIHGKNS